MRIILASKSPRRSEILSNLGIDFEIITKDTDENSDITNAEKLTEELAIRKGKAVVESLTDASNVLIISCDTVVVNDGKILGKPKNEEDAINMLKGLRNRSHTVISGLCLIYNGKVVVSHEKTQVYFANISDENIKKYVATKDPMDKAGGYAVQGVTSLWIEKIEGCYFNVVGFPTRLFCKILNEIGIDEGSIITK